ncbi:zinc ribbon domain-containing protein [Fischerella sp. PCC 9605]|uniref:zinc ribbon domain-containing protein n=1 Tax=Fischerella sp. PCC 9605 TaxID=1173024 RepID=UPI0004AE4211|nr:hypothetical protein [Fischerella sp. PCC 9605]
MALISCPECQKEGISDQALTCPHCGVPIAMKSPSRLVSTALKRVGIPLLLAALGFMLDNPSDRSESDEI